MPLVKTTLQTAIKNAFKAQTTKKDNPDAALDDLASQLAEAVINCIKSADIMVAGVATAGSATAQVQTAPVKASIA
ncbi:MAG: hypothetical protein K2Q03_03550 [Sphingobacteriaceae bacterium]|nr:hypothetical protein [Sphingobacteriaceae bacterium]